MTDAEILKTAKKLVSSQAEDEGLWFPALCASESYLQKALRELHMVIEGETPEDYEW